MGNYNPNAKSLVYGLSDFWTLYFKDLDIIEEMYRGMEIEVGQVYLDLLSLLLNNSVQDTALFHRDLFKLIRIREDAITYSSDARYGFALPQEVAGLSALNNKVFNVTAALEKDVDFTFDAASRSLLFRYDPFSAYPGYTFGTGNAAFTVSTRVTGFSPGDIDVVLADTATHPPTLARSGYTFTIAFDSSQTTAAEVVSLINTNTDSKGLLRAELAGTSTGADKVVADSAALLRVERAPLEGFATRSFDVSFGTRFRVPLSDDWMFSDVQKGDVLRILQSPGYGTSAEFPVTLVRPEGLYLYAQAAPDDLAGKLDYAVLRSPPDDTVTEEPFEPTGTSSVLTTTGTIVGATRTLLLGTPLWTVTVYNVGDTVELLSAVNAGSYKIIDVVSPTELVIEGNPLVDETGVTARIYSNIAQQGTDGALTLLGGGSANFNSGTAFFGANMVGGYILLTIGGETTFCECTGFVDSNNVTISVPAAAVNASSLAFAAAPLEVVTYQTVYSPPDAWLLPGSVSIFARRYGDAQAVVEGRDYTVNIDTGVVRQLTLWQPSITNRIDYRYRTAVAVSYWDLSGSTGSLNATNPLTFVAPTAAFTSAHVGAMLELSGCATAANDGIYYIQKVFNATTVSLTSDRTPTAPDANNGSIVWKTWTRGAVDVTDVVEPVLEIGAWSPDTYVDKYSLYLTYGYLINRIQTSSEQYRQLIRGLFQLFMLGPTLERFESAVNVVGGLDVIRDDGEVFLGYSSGALRSGSDGVFDGATRRFSSATAVFTSADLNNKVFVTSGYNQNKLFTIAQVIDATTVELAETPVTDTAVGWEITYTGTHSITTSRATYTYPRAAPLKAKFLDPLNVGVLTLKAFEVVTAAFTVTDYVETPTWWESSRIPEVLLPDYTPERRQSTPSLFENTIGAPDGSCIGDPGLFVGADDTGFVPTRPVLQSGTQGQLVADPLYPDRTTETYFTASDVAFTAKDVGNYVELGGGSYRIANVLTATNAQIVSDVPLTSTAPGVLPWSLRAGTLPLRHKAAYVILDRLLKYHVFSVAFDAYLVDKLPSSVIQDLEELVFVAKPAYTYLFLTPALLFQELIRVQEAYFNVQATLRPGGQGGEIVLEDPNPLRVGNLWNVGAWYRYVSNTSTFSSPSGTGLLTNVLGAPGAGYRRRVGKLYITPTDFVWAGRPAPYDREFFQVSGVGGTNAAISTLGGETVITLNNPQDLTGSVLLAYVEISSPGPVAGRWRIGRMLTGQQFVLAASLPPATNVVWDLVPCGSQEGRFWTDAYGASYFTETLEAYPGAGPLFTFAPGYEGYLIRRPVVGASGQQFYRIAEFVSSTTVRVAEEYLITGLDQTTYVDVISADTIRTTDYLITEQMTSTDRLAADPATWRSRIYYMEFLSGANAGTKVELLQYRGPNTCTVNAVLTPETGATVQFTYQESYTGVTEGGAWEVFEPSVSIDNTYASSTNRAGIPMDTAAGTVNYTAYGVQEPVAGGGAVIDVTSGDTYYAVGGRAPVTRYGRQRSSRDTEIQDWPVQIARTSASVSVTSTRVNQTQYTNQWAYRSASMPSSGGVMVSLWAKMPTPVTSHPTTRGNTEVLRINFANWYLRCISFNFNTTSGSVGDLNTNSMLFADGTAVSESASSWVSDTTYLLDTGVPWTYENGWVFLAWQAVCDGSGNLTLRQWVRYAGQAVQGPYTTTYTLAALRADLVANAGWTSPHANAWTPSQTIASVQLNGNDGSDAYLLHARVEDVTGTPTNAHILALSNLTSADATAWADWSLEWSGSADLTDRSGNGRALTSMGGSLSAGGTFP